MPDQAFPPDQAAFADNQGGAAFSSISQQQQRSRQLAALAKSNPNLLRAMPNLAPDQLPRG